MKELLTSTKILILAFGVTGILYISFGENVPISSAHGDPIIPDQIAVLTGFCSLLGLLLSNLTLCAYLLRTKDLNFIVLAIGTTVNLLVALTGLVVAIRSPLTSDYLFWLVTALKPENTLYTLVDIEVIVALLGFCISWGIVIIRKLTNNLSEPKMTKIFHNNA